MEFLLKCETFWYESDILEPNATPYTLGLIEKSHRVKMDNNIVIKREEEDFTENSENFVPQDIVKVEPEDTFSDGTLPVNDQNEPESMRDVPNLENQSETDGQTDGSSDKERYSCKDCGKSFTSKSGVWRHAKKHAENDESYSCIVCDKKFARKSGLHKHMETHTNINKFEAKCPICARPFDNHYNYDRHMKSHASTSDPNSCKCEHCGKTFSNRSNLRTHMKRHEGDDKPAASAASAAPAAPSAVSKEEPGEEERTFACDGCEKVFKSKHYLKEHARIHLAKNPYKCMLCEKQLSCKANLMVHMRTHVRKGTGSEMDMALMDLL